MHINNRITELKNIVRFINSLIQKNDYFLINSKLLEKLLINYSCVFFYVSGPSVKAIFTKQEIESKNFVEFKIHFTKRTIEELSKRVEIELLTDEVLLKNLLLEVFSLVDLLTTTLCIQNYDYYTKLKSSTEAFFALGTLSDDDSFALYQEKLKILIENYNFLLKKTRNLFFQRKNLFKVFFSLKQNHSAKFYLFCSILTLDYELSLLLEQLICFRKNIPDFHENLVFLKTHEIFVKDNKNFNEKIEKLINKLKNL